MKTKNFSLRYFLYFLMILLPFLLFTCDPGLGKAVDTQAPKVAINYPATKSVLKGGFTIKGTASDEVKVASCVVTFKNIKNSNEYKFDATVENDEFTVSVNTPKEDGSFELPDGDYNVTVTVSDAYRNSTADVVYTIDNTAPTVLITSPNSYSVSNWPNMYKTFNIKGEVYDSSSLESVTVYLVDEQGSVLKSVVADGTNTFLASFDQPFDEEKLCFYYAVAKDAGGNVNTYCYHKSDIFQLLSEANKTEQNIQLAETQNIVFPSINSIGYVDQGEESNLTELIDSKKLASIKIDNNAAKKVDGKYVFPGFSYFKENAAQIKWLNISSDVTKVAGISIGSPVLGTIMPPTDGSEIKYETVSVWVSKIPNDFKQEEEFNTPEEFKDYLNKTLFIDSNKLESCVIKEGETGDKQVKLTAVGESLNFQVDSCLPGDEGNDWVSGFYYIKVEFTTGSGVTNYDFCKFEVTSGAPKLTEGTFAEGKEYNSYYRGYITSKNSKTLGGKSLTSDGNSPVELAWLYTGTTIAGEYVESQDNKIMPQSDGSYSIEINHDKDGEYTYTLTAAPNSSLSTVISRVVVVDSTSPVVSFGNILDGDILNSTEFTVKGSIEDANGIESVEFLLQENGTSGTWAVIPNAKSSFNLTLSNLKENVNYTLKLRATDVAGNVTGSDDFICNFTIDLANPVATIEDPKPDEGSSIVFVKDIPTFAGKATDDVATANKQAKNAVLSYSKDGGSFTSIQAGTENGKFNWNQQNGTWTWNPTVSQFNGTGKYDVKLVVTDDAGKSTESTLTISLDTTLPSIKLTQVSPYVERTNVQNGESKYYVNGEIIAKFDITENDYIKSIDWYKPDGTKDTQNLGTNAQPTVSIKTTDFADTTKLSQFKLVVTDRSGNQATFTGDETELANYQINQDSDLPIINFTGIIPEVLSENEISADKNLLSTSDSLSITFTDDDGIKSATYQIDNNSVQNISGVDAKVKTETISLSTLAQGEHTIKVTVTDIYGTTVSTNTIFFGIDDKAPELTIDGYSDNNIDAGFKNASFDVTGSSSDSYEFGKLIWKYDDSDVETQIERAGDNKWTLNITKPDSSQKKTIKFVATDKFLRQTVKSFTYAFDLDKPNLTIEEDKKAELTGKFFNQNSMLTLSGIANDLTGDNSTQSGLKIVQYGIGAGHNASSVNQDGWQPTNGTSEWTVLLNIPNYSDGQYTLFVKAVDNSANESEIQKFNITADSTSPVLTEGGSTDASGTSYASGILNLTGTVTDVNLSKVTYTYSLDGNDIEKEIEIVTNNTSNANEKSWNIVKDNLDDGTHIFKIVATDKAGNSSVITRNIIIDETAPVITTNVSPQIMYDNGSGEELTVNGTISVNVRVAETNKLKAVYYTEKDSSTLADDADWSENPSFNETELAAGKIISVDTTKFADKTSLPLRIKAVDEAGNFAVANVNPIVNQASDKPKFIPSNLQELNSLNDAGWKDGNPINVFGSSNSNLIFTLSDDDSVAEYWVKIDDGIFEKVANVNSTQQIVTYSLSSLISEKSYGRHTITFRVKDCECKDDLSTINNYVDKVYYIAIDDGEPSLIINNTNNEYVGQTFTIKGSTADKNGIVSVWIQRLSDGALYQDGGLILGNGLTESGGVYTFNYEFTVPQENKDTIQIVATDSIGNIKTAELSYLVDKTNPVLVFDGKTVDYVDGDYPSLRVAGTATDGDKGLEDSGISGIDQVRLKFGSSITGIDDENSVLATGKIENGVMAWSTPLDFTDKTAGEYIVYVRAFDIAGNASEEKTITVHVDTDKPVLTHSYVDNFIGTFNNDFVIEGLATDSSGVTSVKAKIQGTNKELDSSREGENWSFTVPADVSDGQLTILVTAYDGLNKFTQETFTATLDTVKPNITFTDISDDDNSNTTIETSKTTTTSRVSVTYADSTSGVNNIDYAFYFKPLNPAFTVGTPDENGFVDYSEIEGNAKGSFTRSKSFSGTVIMRMAESTGSKGAFINTETETDGIWYVKVTATDEAGNVAEVDSPYFYVDQHKPKLEVTLPGASENLKKQNDSLTVAGITSDSHGGDIDKVVIEVTHPNYNSTHLEKFTKTFTKDGSNGTELLSQEGSGYKFEYKWDEANSPFIYPDVYELLISTYDVAGNETVRTPQKLSCDNTAPTISFARPYSYSVDSYGNVTSGSVVNAPIGDTNIKAVVDDYSMANVYYQIGGTVTVDSTGTKGTNTYKITKLSVADGAAETDTYGTSVSDVKLDGINVALAGNWNRLNSANWDFDVEYNTLNMVNASKTYHVDDDKDTIQTLDIHLVAVDTAGNINYCKMPLKVDTDTDKPTLLMLSPKTINDVANVGGTATISGTVNDDNAVHSVWMQVELVNGNYDASGNLVGTENAYFGIDYETTPYEMALPQNIEQALSNSNSTDNSYFRNKNQWYKVNLGSENETSTTWNMVLNKGKEFDNNTLYQNGFLTTQVEQTELIVRVKALDTKDFGGLTVSADAKEGDITEFTLKIDSGSPSIVIDNIADFPTEGSYIGGRIPYTITFIDDEKITEYKIEALSSANGDSRSMIIATDANQSGLTDNNNEPLTITGFIDTEEVYSNCGNLIQLRIYAKDNSKDASGQNEQPKESSITFKYTIDNSAPNASFVSTIDSKSYYIDTETVIGDLTGAHRETEERENHLRIMSNQAAFTGKVFDETNGSGIDYVMLYFTKGNNLYNPSKKDSYSTISTNLKTKDKDGNSVEPLFPVASLKDVVRTSGISNPYIVIDRAEGMLDSGANGDLDGYDENLKANGEWVVYIESSNLPDGVYDIHYVVVDYAGNTRYYSDSMFVQNNAPTITSIVLATDIDGDGDATISSDGTSGEDKLFDTTSFDNTEFTVRNSKLKIKVNVTGGTGDKKYFLRYPTIPDSTTGENVFVTTDSSNSGYLTGIFEIDSFPDDSSNAVDYVVWVEDSVEDELSLSSGEITIDMIMDNEDDVKPVAQFFELNTIIENSASSNKERGSLYKESDAVKGHIEPRANSLFDNETVKDPEVSGTIILRGEVYDNQRISSIKLSLNGSSVNVASWDSTNNVLESKKGTVINSQLGLDGHYVEWAYVWDTNSIVAENVSVSMTVKDSSTNKNSSKTYGEDVTKDNTPRTQENMFTRKGYGYNKMTVDIVPYITAVYRNKTYNTNRTKSGAIPLLREEWSNRIEGFNLGSDTNVIVEITENADGTGDVYSITNIAKSGTTTTFQVPSTAKDGYLSTIVNDIRSINNLNDNSQEYNRESNSYDSKTEYWTDDRYVRIWQNKESDYFHGSASPIYPSMSMGNTGRLFAAFGDYSASTVKYVEFGKTSDSDVTQIYYTYDPAEETDIYVSGEEKVNVLYLANYFSAPEWAPSSYWSGGVYCYDSNAYAHDLGRTTKYKVHRFELMYHNKTLQQFKNIRMKRKDSDDSACIHIAYYDRITSSVHYSVVAGNNTASASAIDSSYGNGASLYELSWVNIDGSSDKDDTANNNGVTQDGWYTSKTDGSSILIPDAQFSATSTKSRATSVGESLDIALTSAGYPVIVYSDPASTLRVARASVDYAKGSGNEGKWNIQEAMLSSDDNYSTLVDYVACEIDSENHLHIVFQNAKGQLCYIKSSTSQKWGGAYEFKNPSVVIAESAMYTDIYLKDGVPYVSYIDRINTVDGLNVAFYDKNIDTNFDGIADGAWETITAPLTKKVTGVRTSLAVHPNPTSSSAWGEAAIGFTPGDYYRVALYIGSGKGH